MHKRFEEISGKQIALAENVGRIMLLDEVLTMSARMVAGTGDFSYEERYDQFDPQLTMEIDKLRAILPQADIALFVSETDEANNALVEIERQAFALTHQDRRQEAIALLTSGEYLRLKKVYADGMKKTTNTAHGLIESEAQHLHTKLLWLAAASAIGVLVLLMVWFFAARSARSWTAERQNAEEMLRLAHDELEVRVVQRTADLSRTNEQLQHEIFERKQTETALRESEVRFRNLVETTSDWIWEVDENIVFTYVSPKIYDILGYEAAEVIGKTPFTLMAPEEARRVADIAGTIAATRNTFTNLENTNLHADGHPVVIETSGVPVFDTEGKFCGYRGINRNVTKRKEFEEELKRSNADLEQFSYAVSHDMRQPLRMISSYLQLIEMGLADQLDSEKRGYFDVVIEGARRIDRMLVELLECSRVGRIGEPPAWIESRAALNEALQFLQPAVAEAQARLAIRGDWPRIFASHDEILSLLLNLIGNAVKFRVAGRTPEITVTSEVVRNEWFLSVTDNGVGIIPDQIKRLFKMFQRQQTRAAYEGTGIGLALCRKIAEHHKGRIWAESSGEGWGSKFCVVLPIPPM